MWSASIKFSPYRLLEQKAAQKRKEKQSEMGDQLSRLFGKRRLWGLQTV
jgi:hypothetical protein